jgi:hypothetical protein
MDCDQIETPSSAPHAKPHTSHGKQATRSSPIAMPSRCSCYPSIHAPVYVSRAQFMYRWQRRFRQAPSTALLSHSSFTSTSFITLSPSPCSCFPSLQPSVAFARSCSKLLLVWCRQPDGQVHNGSLIAWRTWMVCSLACAREHEKSSSISRRKSRLPVGYVRSFERIQCRDAVILSAANTSERACANQERTPMYTYAMYSVAKVRPRTSL